MSEESKERERERERERIQNKKTEKIQTVFRNRFQCEGKLRTESKKCNKRKYKDKKAKRRQQKQIDRFLSQKIKRK